MARSSLLVGVWVHFLCARDVASTHHFLLRRSSQAAPTVAAITTSSQAIHNMCARLGIIAGIASDSCELGLVDPRDVCCVVLLFNFVDFGDSTSGFIFELTALSANSLRTHS